MLTVNSISLPVQSSGQIFGSVSVSKRGVLLLEEGVFIADRISDRLLLVDIQLTPEGKEE